MPGYTLAMSMKHEVDKAVNNVKDTFSEAGHRTKADGERATREAAGEGMTTREKLGSVIREGKERVEAEVDHGKRDVRSNT